MVSKIEVSKICILILQKYQTFTFVTPISFYFNESILFRIFKMLTPAQVLHNFYEFNAMEKFGLPLKYI